MMICHCLGVNDRSIRRSVASGASDVESVAADCGAGSICGGCRPAVADVLTSCGISAVALRSTVRRSLVPVDRVLQASAAG